MAKVKVANVNDVPESELKKVEVGGEQVALYKIDGEVYATTNICTHEHLPRLSI
ncbi:Rieske 2Fe-2S domain-containing protein [Candidatus Curtissbacteria bacterium]|nr:Rieske 2Fe-2S domain-containing protein [Candidatus Curtissbacteria bacterium]